MSMKIISLSILILVETVNSAIFQSLDSHGKFERLHSFRSTDLSNWEPVLAMQRKEADVKGEDVRSRQKRDSGTSDVSSDRVVLKGTESAPIAYIHWVGKGVSERIFILTCKVDSIKNSRAMVDCRLWRSEDYGTTFHELDFGADVNISYLYTVNQDPKKLLFTDRRAKKIYTTADEFNTNVSYTAPVEPDRLAPHPTDDSKLLLYNYVHSELYVSTDFAKTWVLLAENVLPQFHWGVPGYDSTTQKKDTDVVHMEVEGEVPWQAKYKACVIPDCKEIRTEVNPGPFMAGSLTVHKEYMFVQKSNSFGSESYLAVSYKRQPFRRAYFPGNVITDDFYLLNLKDGQVFVAVNHRGYVNLYLSDATGQYFVLSLANIVHVVYPNSAFEIDFHEVQGMMYTFLVNKKENGTVRTYISFDKGGNWAPLMLNRNCTQVKKCALQLKVKQKSGSTPVFSEDGAPGIIMAHGTVGTDSKLCVFTTNDGGGTWVKATLAGGEALTGPHRLNILDQGSLLTAIPDSSLTGNSTAVVYYSVDQGLSWKKSSFDSRGFHVDGVLTEPGLLTMVESVFGHENFKESWVVTKLNFSQVLTKKCEGDDYEPPWSPTDFNNPSSSSCILGQSVKYKRPHPTAACYNGNTITKVVENTTCDCTSEDFECDFGYEESKGGCQKSGWYNESFLPPECDSGGTYGKSQGYRKIPADKCSEKSSDKGRYDPVDTPCPSAKPGGLIILSEALKLTTGKVSHFHLEQSVGSKFDTVYTWNFDDKTDPETVTGFTNASVRSHRYHAAGHYNVTVTAKNSKGEATAFVKIHVQDPLDDVHITAPRAGKTGMEVNFYVSDLKISSLTTGQADREHFVWTFGDEASSDLPTLTWWRNVSHTFKKAGKYRVTTEAINSVSSVYIEFNIEIFDAAEILELTFSRNISNRYFINPYIGEMFTWQIRYQLAEMIGIRLERLEAVQGTDFPVKCHLYIFPSNKAGEPDVNFVKNFVLQHVKQKDLSIKMQTAQFHSDALFPVVSAKELSDSGKHSSSMNLTPVFIAVPVLVLALLVSGISFMYCRRRMRSNRHYNILNTQDDSDALLDDDEPPLDLNTDFSGRDHMRDEAMLDIDDSRLEVITGGSSDNAENC